MPPNLRPLPPWSRLEKALIRAFAAIEEAARPAPKEVEGETAPLDKHSPEDQNDLTIQGDEDGKRS